MTPALQHLDLIASAPDGVKWLRELILELAVRGKLVENQDAGHWELTTLSDIGEWGSGGTPLKGNSNYYGGDIPWLVIGDLNDGLVTTSATSITQKGVENSSAKIIPAGTLLIAMYGSIGKLGITGIDCSTNQAIAHCRPSSAKVDIQFLFYFFKAIRERLISKGQGLAQQNISQKILKAVEIYLPPLSEQHRIVAKVDELMALCDQLEAQQTNGSKAHATLVKALLDALTQSQTAADFATQWQRIAQHFDTLFSTEASIDALKQTILQLAVMGKLVPQNPNDEPASELLKRIQAEKAKLVAEGKIKKDKPLPEISEDEKPFELPAGWEWVRFSGLGEFKGGKTPSTNNPAYWDGEIPWVSPKDMRPLTILDTEDYVTELAVRDGLGIIPANSVLIVVRSGILRRMVPVAINLVECTVNQDLKALCLVMPEMANYIQLMVRGFQRLILEKLTKTGMTVESIMFDEFSKHPFPLPSLPEQHRIVAKVDELMAHCDQLTDRLKSARERSGQYAIAATQSALEAA